VYAELAEYAGLTLTWPRRQAGGASFQVIFNHLNRVLGITAPGGLTCNPIGRCQRRILPIDRPADGEQPPSRMSCCLHSTGSSMHGDDRRGRNVVAEGRRAWFHFDVSTTSPGQRKGESAVLGRRT
jgi:hypothetical protein